MPVLQPVPQHRPVHLRQHVLRARDTVGPHAEDPTVVARSGIVKDRPLLGQGLADQAPGRVLAEPQHSGIVGGMFRAITMRDVPDETGAELAARAASGRSLQEYLRGRLIEMAERPAPEAWVARVRARKASAGTSMSAAEILALRDAARG